MGIDGHREGKAGHEENEHKCQSGFKLYTNSYMLFQNEQFGFKLGIEFGYIPQTLAI